ncbi:MAG TPA: hypothetical protein VED41_08525, partial [Solirubrobacteraceae bacterium]|nr:hypothetical protein [Solirubrobacteraceae bacterium]
MSRPAEQALRAFYTQAAREHARTLAATDAIEREVRLGDRRIRLCFAGAGLADALTGALTPNLLDASAPADFTVGLWEESRVPGGRLALPWRDVDLAARGLLRVEPDAQVVAVHEAGSGAVTLVDRAAGQLLHRVPDAQTLPWWERAAPLRPAFFWALGGPRRHLVHAGAVGDERRGGVLLAGAGGSGKTTVALAAVSAGMAYVADDYLLLHAEREPAAWNLYGTAKLDAGHLARFPELAGAVTRSTNPLADEKFVLDVAALAPQRLARSLPIRAVLVPHIRGGHARLRRTSAGQALLALAPSTTFQMPFDDGRAVRTLADVARGLPAFALDVGDDPRELVQALDDVLDAAGDQRPSCAV